MNRILTAVGIVVLFAALGAVNFGFEQPTLYVFCTPDNDCPHCKAAKQRYREHKSIANLIDGYAISGVVFLTWDGQKWNHPDGTKVYTEFVRTTGTHVTSWPTSWLSGSGSYMVGYQ